MNNSSTTVQDDEMEMEDTMTPSNTSSSFDIHRNDSQTDLNKYVINYVDETSTQTNFDSTNKSHSRLEVSQLPDEVSIHVFMSI